MPRVVAITGACTDTAVATARHFAARGSAVALLSRTPAAVDAATAEVRTHGTDALGIVVDTTNADAVETAVDRIEDRLGPVDVWVNTAEPIAVMHFDDLDPTELKRVTDVMYLGHVHSTMTALERMKDRDAGVIVHVTTPLAWRGRAGFAAVSGAQSALRGFHEAVAEELRHDRSKVRVVLVEQAEGVHPDDVATAVLQASRPQDRRSQMLRMGALSTGAAVAAGTAAVLRRRRP